MKTSRKYIALLLTMGSLGLLLKVPFPESILAQQSGDRKPEGSPHGKAKPVLSDREIRVRQALNSHLSVNFKGISMKEVLEYLQDKTTDHLRFFLDEVGLKEATGSRDARDNFYNDPIAFEAKNIKVRKLLKILLDERDMGYYYEDGMLVLTHRSKLTMVKVYELGDLLDPKNVAGSRAELVKALKLVNPRLRFDTDPEPAPEKGVFLEPVKIVQWPVNAQFLTHKRRLVVRESPEMHEEIERLLLELRGIVPPKKVSSDEEFPGIDLDSRR